MSDVEPPKGWKYVNLFSLCNPKQWPTISTKQLTDSGYPVYGANGQIGFYTEYNHNDPTILITCRGATCGKINVCAPKSYVTGNSMALDGTNEKLVLLPFLRMALEARGLDDTISGSAQPQITRTSLEIVEVPLAPLVEQRRIVEKVEALLERVNQAKARLDRVPLILKRFRQSILAAACSGELTREWRAAEKSSSAEKALERARTERYEAWLATAPSRKACNYVFPQVAKIDADLPGSWGWTTGREMFLWASGAFLPKGKMQKGGIPVYGGNGVSGYHSQALADSRTIVVGRVGALCGNVHVTEGPAWITDNAIFAAWAASMLNLDFARIVLASRNLNANAGGSGQPFVSQELLDAQILPFPPPEEQAAIVATVKVLLAIHDGIAHRVNAVVTRLGRLQQAILSKAFSGELVPTEAELARIEGRAFESAEELLKRVASTATQSESKANTRRRRASRKAG